jgi:hypothetical protein
MITAYAIFEEAAAITNDNGEQLDDRRMKLMLRPATKFLRESLAHVSPACLDDGQRQPGST